jgi:hypothetical protein
MSATTPSDPRLSFIPLSEAAHHLSVSWAAAWRLVLTGRLKGEKVAGKWMVSVASLREVRGSCEVPPATGSGPSPKVEDNA